MSCLSSCVFSPVLSLRRIAERAKTETRRCTIPAALAFLVGQGEFGGGAEAGTSSKRQQENEVVRPSGLDRALLGREAAEGLNDSWSVLDQPPLVRKLRTDQ